MSLFFQKPGPATISLLLRDQLATSCLTLFSVCMLSPSLPLLSYNSDKFVSFRMSDESIEQYSESLSKLGKLSRLDETPQILELQTILKDKLVFLLWF